MPRLRRHTRGDPTPVCFKCGEYQSGSHLVYMDGRVLCYDCGPTVPKEDLEAPPTHREVQEAIESIRRAL